MRWGRGISEEEGEEEEPELRLNFRTNTKDVRRRARRKRKSSSGAKLRSRCSHAVVVEQRPSFADYTFAIQAIEDDADEREKSWNDMAEILTWQAWRDKRDRRADD